ncbi:MAG TPA: hypothetical protein VGV91_05815 [Rubrobacter sp.]|nr:hypothetical protein [Rubrobacter sp.]
MTTLNDLEAFIEVFEITAREQDATVGQFFHYLEGLGPDAALKFRADALPEVGARKPLVRRKPVGKPGALLIRA